jgi:hypothetical protein
MYVVRGTHIHIYMYVHIHIHVYDMYTYMTYTYNIVMYVCGTYDIHHYASLGRIPKVPFYFEHNPQAMKLL